MSSELYQDVGLGIRLRRVNEALAVDVEKIYAEAGIDFKSRYFYVIYALDKHKSMTIAQLQAVAGLTHSAVSQTVKQLHTQGLVMMTVGEDARSRVITLSADGQKLVETLYPLWGGVEAVIKAIRQETANDIFLALDDFEEALFRQSFYQRMQMYQRSEKPGKIEIVPFHVSYKQDWADISLEWLEKDFEVEEIDRNNLENPEENILAKGGEIYFALMDQKPVGAVGLKCHPGGVFEVSKMGVRTAAQGKGIGRKLLQTTIDRYNARGGTELFLETHGILEDAFRLYKKMGFAEVPLRKEAPYGLYSRCDYLMIYQGA